MDKAYTYVAFFDLDKTILSVNSGELLVRQAYWEGLMGTKDILKGIYFSVLYKLGLKETTKIITDMAMWMAGLAEETVVKLTKNLFEKQLISAIRSEIYMEIDHHKKNNGEVVILSATIPAMCKLFAAHFRLNNFICSELEIVDGKFTGHPVGNFCFGDEKRTRLEKYCKEHNYALEDAYYYADAISDLSALNIVGNPVCVNPENRLTQQAHQKGWIVYNW